MTLTLRMTPIATMMVLAGAPGSHLFPQVPDKGAAKHVNGVLRKLF
jgi:hypothetical protein